MSTSQIRVTQSWKIIARHKSRRLSEGSLNANGTTELPFNATGFRNCWGGSSAKHWAGVNFVAESVDFLNIFLVNIGKGQFSRFCSEIVDPGASLDVMSITTCPNNCCKVWVPRGIFTEECNHIVTIDTTVCAN